MGRYSYTERIDLDGTVNVHNSLVGRVTTVEERRSVHVDAFVKFVVDESGFELQQLRVNYRG